ncbi:hypothetical protein DID78_04880 [Candidatus Marinamargulisbacteria bacterium SCGC AG-343-D04]|nr:hypothetical protein DID78_04880 [Candidatus Marinamargulisbacteria bacterium SCGC AG-343-D04]
MIPTYTQKLIFFCISILLSSHTISALSWEAIHSLGATVYYPKHKTQQAYQAIHSIQYFQPKVNKILGVSPPPFPLIIEDIGQNPNGMVTLFPLKMRLYTADAFLSPYFYYTNNWLDMLVIHELVHTAHLSAISPHLSWKQKLFGSAFYPHAFSPTWFSEGLAVYIESELSPSMGRLNNPSVTAYFKQAASQKQLLSFNDINITSPKQYPFGSTPYLYGGRFIRYLAKQYGQPSIRQFIKDYSTQQGSILNMIAPRYFYDKSAKKVFGKSFKDLYSDWLLTEEQSLDKWSIQGQKITPEHTYTNSLSADKNTLWINSTQWHYPAPFLRIPYITLRSFSTKTQSWTSTQRLYRPPSLPIQFSEHHYYIAFQNTKNGFHSLLNRGKGYITDLYRIRKTDKKRKLIFSGKIDAFAALEDDKTLIINNTVWSTESSWNLIHEQNPQKLATLNLSVAECDSETNTIACLGINENQQWELFTLRFPNMTPTTLFQSETALTGIQLTDSVASFTQYTPKGSQTLSIDLLSSSAHSLSTGTYVGNGIPIGSSLFFTVPGKNEIALYSQSIHKKSFPPQKTAPPSLEKRPNFRPPSHPINALWSSTKASLPSIKMGVFNYGEDDLRLLHYHTLFNGTGIEGNITSKHFLPYILNFDWNSGSKRVLIERSVYTSLSQGIQDIYTGIIFQPQYQYGLYSSISLGWRSIKAHMSAMAFPESSHYFASYTSLYSHKKFSIKRQVNYTYQYPMNDILRGYRYVTIKNTRALQSSLDIMLNVGNLFPFSSYSPSLSFEDTFLAFFTDYSSSVKAAVFGIYIEQELLATIWAFPLSLTFGESFYNNSLQPFIEIKMGF